MATTLIFGGSGKVAKHITRLLVAEGNHTVYSIIRSAEQSSTIEGLGGKPILQSIEDSSVDDFVTIIQRTKPNTVIWTAGAGGKGGPTRTNAIDYEGAVKSMDATAKAGVKRYIMISAVDVRDREKATPEWYDESDLERSERMWTQLKAYMEAKLKADRSLVVENGRRGLEYTIVRPGSLTDDAAKGKVVAGKVRVGGGASISREDVAAVVVQVMKKDGTKGLAFDVVDGETPIADAVAEVAKSRADPFAGGY